MPGQARKFDLPVIGPMNFSSIIIRHLAGHSACICMAAAAGAAAADEERLEEKIILIERSTRSGSG